MDTVVAGARRSRPQNWRFNVLEGKWVMYMFQEDWDDGTLEYLYPTRQEAEDVVEDGDLHIIKVEITAVILENEK